MNFDFTPVGDTKQLLNGKAASYFTKARKGTSAQTFAHREWMRDVFRMFAHKAEVTLPQAIQLIKTGEFNRAHRMHGIHLEKTPSQIIGLVKGKPANIPNPAHVRFEALKNMRAEDNHGFIRDGFIWAISLRHPEERVGHGKPSEVDIPKVNKRHIKHDDETRESHVRRTVQALIVAIDPTDENIRELGRSFGL